MRILQPLLVGFILIAVICAYTMTSMGSVIVQQRQLIREMTTNPYCMGAK